jgi:hypothetical protein
MGEETIISTDILLSELGWVSIKKEEVVVYDDFNVRVMSKDGKKLRVYNRDIFDTREFIEKHSLLRHFREV